MQGCLVHTHPLPRQIDANFLLLLMIIMVMVIIIIIIVIIFWLMP